MKACQADARPCTARALASSKASSISPRLTFPLSLCSLEHDKAAQEGDIAAPDAPPWFLANLQADIRMMVSDSSPEDAQAARTRSAGDPVSAVSRIASRSFAAVASVVQQMGTDEWPQPPRPPPADPEARVAGHALSPPPDFAFVDHSGSVAGPDAVRMANCGRMSTAVICASAVTAIGAVVCVLAARERNRS